MPKFSIVYLTYRTGGYDLLADGLANQTCQDYELICVDELTQFKEVRDLYLRGRGVKVSAILPSKKPCFPGMAYNLINAYNTGLMMSRGDYIIICNDYTWLPPDALAKWEAREDDLNRDVAFSGVGAIVHVTPPVYLNHPISPWAEGSAVDAIHGMYRYDDKLTELWIPGEFEMFYSIFSYDLLKKINGFQECYDYTFNNQIEPVVRAVKSVGGEVAVDKGNRIYMIEHRHFEFDFNPGQWHLSKRAGSGSRTTLIEEPNCFDLKTHPRGIISGNTN
jgi:glycosyltransferase involved in cell wall biosynthesis